MSRHGRRRSRSRHQESAHQQSRHRSVPPTAEPADELIASPSLANSERPEVCGDDRPGPDVPGSVLLNAREARGLTLDEISRTTKIGRPILRALETADVLHLPAAIYTRGFVKAYAREVGLDPDLTADEYLRAIEPLRTHHLLVDDGELPPLAQAPAPLDPNGDARHVLAFNQARRFSRVSVLLAAIGLVMYVVSFPRGDDAAPAAAAEGPGSTTSSPDAIAARGQAAANDVARASVADGPLRFEIVTQAECWVSARVDGEQVLSRLLAPGQRETIEVVDEVVLRVGEPAALSLSINGRSSRPLGPAGRPITVRITKDNFRDFLSL